MIVSTFFSRGSVLRVLLGVVAASLVLYRIPGASLTLNEISLTKEPLLKFFQGIVHIPLHFINGRHKSVEMENHYK